jgi:hypothetical protein
MRVFTLVRPLAVLVGLSLLAACGQVGVPSAAKSPTVARRPSSTPHAIKEAVPSLPPEKPSPSPSESAQLLDDQLLLHNALYSAGRVAAVECSLPTARLANKQAMIRYATAFVQCLNRAWEPVIKRANFGFVPPAAVHSAPTGTDSVCGVMQEDVGAFYCDTDLGIYFNWPAYAVKEANRQEAGRASVQYLIAHEYGHHVQYLTGMAHAYGERYQAATSAATQGEEDRNEMQAHCFAAAFFGANQKTLRLHGDRLAQFGHPGFQRSEVGDNFPRWLGRGFKAKGPGACITWAAPAAASKVS